MSLWQSLRTAVRPYRAEPLPDPCADRDVAERARQLLVACLTPAQRAEFMRRHSFTVLSRSGQRYRITFGTTANVEVLDERGQVMHRLCAAPSRLATCAVM